MYYLVDQCIELHQAGILSEVILCTNSIVTTHEDNLHGTYFWLAEQIVGLSITSKHCYFFWPLKRWQHFNLKLQITL